MEATEYIKTWRHLSEQFTSAPGAYISELTAFENELRDGENHLRKLFSTQRDSWEVPELEDQQRYLVPVYGVHDPSAFVAAPPLERDVATPKVFPLAPEKRLAPGTPTTVTHAHFLRNFEVFTEGMLRYLDWSNVFAAGGSVLACLQPVPDEFNDCNRSRRKYFHDVAYPGSDVDLFLYGLDADGAKRKIEEIYDAVREACPYDAVCFRSAHAVTVVTQYPYRHVQVVLRLYSAPCEVLAGFDVNSCAVGFDGKQVWLSPRCHQSLVRQCNPVDLSRRSPTYEMRLAKYAKRGFEVLVPSLDRQRVSPMLFETPWHKVQGLAKLLLLEQLSTPEARFRYQEQHRLNQMRPPFSSSFAQKFRFQQMLHNPWLSQRMEDVRGGADASDYSTVFLPWGPGYTAKRCVQLMAAKDKLLNNPFLGKAKGRQYKLHACFWGSASTVMEDCFPKDPPIPPEADPEVLAGFVRGPLKFIEDDPGRQMIGSFHPITDGSWSAAALLSPLTEELVLAANSNDTATIRRLLQQPPPPAVSLMPGDGADPPAEAAAATPESLKAQAAEEVNKIDFFGRSALHLAVMSGCLEAVSTLLEFGASLSARMADGRHAVHLAVIYGRDAILDVLLAEHARLKAERDTSAGAAATVGDKAAEEGADAWEDVEGEEKEGDGEDDDGDDDEEDGGDEEGEDEDDEDEDGSVKVPKQKAPKAAADEAAAAAAAAGPAVVPLISLDDTDWGRRMSPLHYALVLGRKAAAEKLLASGASATIGWVPAPEPSSPVFAPPMLLRQLARTNPTLAGQLLTLLVQHGCSLVQLDIRFKSLLHQATEAGHTALLKLLLEAPEGTELREVVNAVSRDCTTPLMAAVSRCDVEAVQLLLGAGARPSGLDEAGCEIARQRFKSYGKVLRALPTWEQNRLRALDPSSVDAPLKTAVSVLTASLNMVDDDHSEPDDDEEPNSDDGEDEDGDEAGKAEPATTTTAFGGDAEEAAVVPELAQAQEAEALGGRTSPEVRKPYVSQLQRAFTIVRLLLAAGADPNALVNPSTTLLDDLRFTRLKQEKRYASIKQAALGKVPAEVLDGDSAQVAAWASKLLKDVTGGAALPDGLCPAALEAYQAYIKLHGAESYLAVSARARLEQVQASFLVGLASVVASNPGAQLKHLTQVADMLTQAGAKSLRDLQSAGKLPWGATIPENWDDFENGRINSNDYYLNNLTNFIGTQLSAPPASSAPTAPAPPAAGSVSSAGGGGTIAGSLQQAATTVWLKLGGGGGGGGGPGTVVQYHLLPEPTVDNNGQVEYPRQGSGLVLPLEQQNAYHQLFEAVWRGDIDAVKRMTSDTAPDPAGAAASSAAAAPHAPLFVAVHSSQKLTPLALAVLRGDAAMAVLLLETAVRQYTPTPPPDADSEDGQEDKKQDPDRINNYALAMALQNAAYGDYNSDYDSDESEEDDDYDYDDDDGDGDVDDVVAEALSQARDFATEAALKKHALAGVTTGEVDDKPHVVQCHADALSLLFWKSELPSAALLQQLGARGTAASTATVPDGSGSSDDDAPALDAKACLRELWSALRAGTDSKTLTELLGRYDLSLTSYWFNVPQKLQAQSMASLSPLQAACFAKDPAVLRALLEGFETAVKVGQAPLGPAATAEAVAAAAAAAAAVASTTGEDAAAAAKAADGKASPVVPACEVLHRLVRWAAIDSPPALQIVMDLDRPECLEVLLPYVGVSTIPMAVDGCCVVDGATLYANSSDVASLHAAMRRNSARARRRRHGAAPGAVPPVRVHKHTEAKDASGQPGAATGTVADAAAAADGGSGKEKAVESRVDSWTLLHSAVTYGATAVAGWLLQGQGLQQALEKHCNRVLGAGGCPAANLRTLHAILATGQGLTAAAADATSVDATAVAAVLASALCRDVGCGAPPRSAGYNSSEPETLGFVSARPGGLTPVDIAVLKDDRRMLQLLLSSFSDSDAAKAFIDRAPLPAPTPTFGEGEQKPKIKASKEKRAQSKRLLTGRLASWVVEGTVAIVKKLDYGNTTLLQTAAYRQSSQCFHCLLDLGADVRVADALSKDRNWNVATFLLAGSGARLDVKDMTKEQVRAAKAKLGAAEREMLTALLGRWADAGEVAALLSAQQGPTRVSPLMVAATRGLVELVEIMLRRMVGDATSVAGLRVQDVTGRTPLHAAAAGSATAPRKVVAGAPRLATALLQHEETCVKAGAGGASDTTQAIKTAGMEDFCGLTPLDVCVNLLLEWIKLPSSDINDKRFAHNINVLEALLAVHPEQRRRIPTLAEIQASRQFFTASANAEQAQTSSYSYNRYGRSTPAPTTVNIVEPKMAGWQVAKPAPLISRVSTAAF